MINAAALTCAIVAAFACGWVSALAAVRRASRELALQERELNDRAKRGER